MGNIDGSMSPALLSSQDYNVEVGSDWRGQIAEPSRESFNHTETIEIITFDNDNGTQIEAQDSSSATGICGFLAHSYLVTSVEPLSHVLHRPKNIEMGFSLVTDSGAQRHPLSHEAHMLRKIWPEIRNIIHMPPFLTVVCESIPSTIPFTIAGLPCYFTVDENDIPLKGEFCRGKPIVVGEKLTVWLLPSHSMRSSILESLLLQGVCSIAWLGTRWLLEVDKVAEDTKYRLPSLINGLVASFRQFVKPKEQGLSRAKIPTAIAYDDTDYFPYLHAGMLISDGEIVTTSGCPIYHPEEPTIQYFSMASHGCVTGAEVSHPLRDSHVIGVSDKKFGESDISLCRITHPDVQYSTECFAGAGGGVRPRKIMKEGDSWIGKELFFDSPLTGVGTGYVLAHGSRFLPPVMVPGGKDIPRESPDPEVKYVANLWISLNTVWRIL